MYTEPLHPYTEALLSAALPLHPSARRQRIVLAGEVPESRESAHGVPLPSALSAGLPQCASQEPDWKEVKPGRFTACHLY